LMIALSYIVLRHKRPEWERPYRAPGGLFTGYLAVAFCLWIIIGSLSEIAPYSLLVLGGYYLIGIASHLYAKRMQKVKPDEWAPRILTPDDL
ncbi:MAG TPA: APC family permease, partial [Thermoanaerobacterales bacterium]|nr:APC family permease [Thermoanaerobacterales bacterium]